MKSQLNLIHIASQSLERNLGSERLEREKLKEKLEEVELAKVQAQELKLTE